MNTIQIIGAIAFAGVIVGIGFALMALDGAIERGQRDSREAREGSASGGSAVVETDPPSSGLDRPKPSVSNQRRSRRKHGR